MNKCYAQEGSYSLFKGDISINLIGRQKLMPAVWRVSGFFVGAKPIPTFGLTDKKQVVEIYVNCVGFTSSDLPSHPTLGC
ncbi:MAG: hypothetical protein ACI8PD_002297 [Nitrospinales bacterium]|jgi:hypothetical protein